MPPPPPPKAGLLQKDSGLYFAGSRRAACLITISNKSCGAYPCLPETNICKLCHNSSNSYYFCLLQFH